MTQPWLCIGDFNAYLKPKDKIGGPPVTGFMVRDFEECCIRTRLYDTASTGLQYTWSNGHIWCKLDRVMVNQEWSGAPFDCSTEFPVPGLHSDHSPCVVKLSEQGDRLIRPFRFYNMWISHPEFHKIVRSVWTDKNLGTKQFMLCWSLRALKHPPEETE